jgi:hypothetical protein
MSMHAWLARQRVTAPMPKEPSASASAPKGPPVLVEVDFGSVVMFPDGALSGPAMQAARQSENAVRRLSAWLVVTFDADCTC